jgi:hypothetical protein
VVSGFRTVESAKQGIQAVEAFGYSPDDVTVISSEQTMQEVFPGRVSESHRRRAAEGAAYGGAWGVVTGAMVGLLAPGMLAAGPIVAAIVAAGGLGATGAILGAWSGMGVPDEVHTKYDEIIEDGGIVLAMDARDATEAASIQQVWDEIL